MKKEEEKEKSVFGSLYVLTIPRIKEDIGPRLERDILLNCK